MWDSSKDLDGAVTIPTTDTDSVDQTNQVRCHGRASRVLALPSSLLASYAAINAPSSRSSGPSAAVLHRAKSAIRGRCSSSTLGKLAIAPTNASRN